MEKKQIIAIAAVVVVIVAAVGIALAMNNNGGNSGKKINSVDDLSGATIGVVSGYTGQSLTLSDIENGALSKDTVVRLFDSGAAAVSALKEGHVDCVIIDEQPAKKLVEANSGLKILDTKYADEDFALAVKKGNSSLREAINGAIEDLKKDGTLEQIETYYYEGTGEKYVRPTVDDTSKGKIHMITNATFPPYESFKDDGSKEVVGFDVDLMQAICSKLGYELECEHMEFESLITKLQDSKNEENYVIAAGMSVTAERQESVDFSESYTTSVQVIITKA